MTIVSSRPLTEVAGTDATKASVLSMRAVKLGEGLFVIWERGNVEPGETGHGALGVIRRDLNLPLQLEHVRSEPGAEQRLFRQAASRTFGLADLQEMDKGLETRREDGRGDGMEFDGHGIPPGWRNAFNRRPVRYD